MPQANSRNLEEIVVPAEKRTEILNEVNDLSDSQYSVNKNIRFKTPMLRSDLCECSDSYNVIKGTMTLIVLVQIIKELSFKNKASLNHAYQKYIEYKENIKILMKLCRCIIS